MLSSARGTRSCHSCGSNHLYSAHAIAHPPPLPRRKLIVLTIFLLFLLPVAARAALFAYADGPRSWRDADWSSTGTLPAAAAQREARVLVMTGQTGGWKGTVAVHSWIVLKRERSEERRVGEECRS